MNKLSIKDFSCLKSAEISVADFTILIGPQASGKSVLSKLLNFFHGIVIDQFRHNDEIPSLDNFTDVIADKFRMSFPPSAWGKKKFVIKYTVGIISIQITRPSLAVSKQDKIVIDFSEAFQNAYQDVHKSYLAAIEKLPKSKAEDPRERFHILWRMQDMAQKKVSELMGKQAYGWQVFIPAARSFFTSVGKVAMAFDQGGMLDPVTFDFGRLFVSLRERSNYYYFRRKADDEDPSKFAHQFFGGEVVFQKENNFIKTKDGRIIPYSFWSSGQQELFPLWLMLEYASKLEDDDRILLYIEEPEAHLFPTAQSALLEYIVQSANLKKKNRGHVITTHSPYILAKMNNLLKAGKLASLLSKNISEPLNKIVNKKSWLKPNSTVVYALKDGCAKNIMDQEGLIDASYIDEISEDISNEFSALLNIEYKYAKKQMHSDLF